MNKKLLPITLLFLAVAVIAIYALANSKKDTAERPDIQNSVQQTNQGQTQETNGIILFYGDGCPHCALVEKYIADNAVEGKVVFTKKEVYYNQSNAAELTQKASACGLATDSIGVPFLWDGSTCLVGDQPIIDFFKQKIGQ